MFFDTELIVMDDNEPEDLSAIERLERRIEQLESRVEDRQNRDNIIFARMREDLDANLNKAKEDQVIITGITSRTIQPADAEGRKIWIKDIVTKIFNEIVQDFPGKIHYVNQMRNNGQQIPMVEVKLDSAINANIIRKAFAEKRKAEGTDVGRLFIANSVNLATRVRVDILKALARKITDKDLTAHTVPFVSRPVIHVRSTDSANHGNKTYTFVDAITKFGHLVKQVELGEAYRRAGNSFKGQMEQQFIILREQQGASGGGPRPRAEGSTASRKRPREDDEREHEHFNGYQRKARRGRWAGNRGYRR